MTPALDEPGSETPPSGRRRTLLGVTAAVSALAGVGAAWWSTPSTAALPANAPPEGFWDMDWVSPQGAKVSMQSFKGRPLLLNFWATWCAPCVEELPLIDAFYKENKAKGWQVLALAVDRPEPVQLFLQKMPLEFPVAMAGMAGSELGRALGNLTGGLPFSVVLGAEGLILQRKMGRLSDANLKAWAGLK